MKAAGNTKKNQKKKQKREAFMTRHGLCSLNDSQLRDGIDKESEKVRTSSGY